MGMAICRATRGTGFSRFSRAVRSHGRRSQSNDGAESKSRASIVTVTSFHSAGYPSLCAVSRFSSAGRRCRDRLHEQLKLRFLVDDINDIKALLLDQRIKAKAASIVADPVLLGQVEEELRLEHEVIFQALAPVLILARSTRMARLEVLLLFNCTGDKCNERFTGN
jgi:hypothetical protein